MIVHHPSHTNFISKLCSYIQPRMRFPVSNEPSNREIDHFFLARTKKSKPNTKNEMIPNTQASQNQGQTG
jgi:hypothetical protein